MPHADPVLDLLIAAERSTGAAHEAARAALAAYRGDGPAVPESDFVSLREGEVEFGRSSKQLRRWVNDEGLGVEIDGKLYLRRSLVLRYKRV